MSEMGGGVMAGGELTVNPPIPAQAPGICAFQGEPGSAVNRGYFGPAG